jgi:xanthine dehydrogenase accessory factor
MTGAFGIVRDCLRAGEPVTLATVVEVSGTAQDSAASEGPVGAGGAPVPVEAASATVLVTRPALSAKIVVRPDTAPLGSLGQPDLDRVVVRDALGALETGLSALRHYGAHGEAQHTDLTVFLEVFAPPRRMVIVGAVDFTAALVRVAKVLGYWVTVCDARPVFATAARFPEADEVVVDWPHRFLAKVADRLSPRDAVCVLTHDHKFDVPAIMAALDTRVGYLGAMGSRRTHAGRVERLRAEGVDEAELGRIMAPIGVDIGARTPEESAVAICAEIIGLRAGVSVSSLRDGSGPIHHTPA